MSYAVKNLMQGSRELIAFRIGDQEFCVNIMSVREIRGWTPATPLPHSPHYVMGVINLRGAVLPIMDLSLRLGMKPVEPTARHVIIVAQVKSRVVGLLVDAVSDILTVDDDNIQPTPEVSSTKPPKARLHDIRNEHIPSIGRRSPGQRRISADPAGSG